jgi:hypothetical protein
MDLPKLSVREIQQKIDLFALRQETLRDIVKDMTDVSAKSALEVQIGSYEKSLEQLRKELEKRKDLA